MIETFTGEYAFLSNFYPAQTKHCGITFPTSEHAYQASKTFHNGWFERIRKADTPAKAKRLGQKCPIRKDWEENKVCIMETILLEKFQHPQLRKKLLLTGDQYLQEGNDWGDRFWGVCRNEAGEWEGENNLGRLLAKLRNYYYYLDLAEEILRGWPRRGYQLSLL